MDLSANIAGLKIDPAIMNASGTHSYPSVLKKYEKYLGAVVIKSTGLKKRPGNETPTVAQASDEAYLNSMGLPNPGYKEMFKELKEIYPLKIPIIASIFGENEDEFAAIAEYLEPVCDMIELNESCPNIKKGEKTGMVIGRDPKLVRKYTETVKGVVKKPVIVKLGPGPYIDDRKRGLEIAGAAIYGGADAIAAINTVPGGMKINIWAKRPVLSAKYGGVSGKAIKPFGVGYIYTIREHFPEIPLIGIGGIGTHADIEETAADIIEYVEAGADAVAIGTGFKPWHYSHMNLYISVIKNRLEKLFEELGVNSLRELRDAAHVK